MYYYYSYYVYYYYYYYYYNSGCCKSYITIIIGISLSLLVLIFSGRFCRTAEVGLLGCEQEAQQHCLGQQP